MADNEDLDLPQLDDDAPIGDEMMMMDDDEDDAGSSSSSSDAIKSRSLDALYEVPVQVSAVLGRASMQVNQLLKLGRGAVVELDRKVGDSIDIYVNNRLVARGEVIVVDDHLGVTLTEIIKSDKAA